ncbi:MAG TPA: glutathione S-transferase family protein [Steroidobacteraceae bacterium]|nr:glutathione S-transferase family protein [Steroidobacteraceae bacterium]
MSGIVVHGIPGSPYVRSALLGFEEKGVPYRLAVMPMGAARTPEYLKRQPFGRIPSMEHGDFSLYETQAILRYADSLSPRNPLQPQEAKAAARMNQIVGIVDWYVFPQITVKITAERLMSQMFWGRGPDEEGVAKALPAASVCVQELERLIGSAPFLAGDCISIADLMLAPHIAMFRMTAEGQGLLRGTHLNEWMDRMAARPSLQATERERLMQAA